MIQNIQNVRKRNYTNNNEASTSTNVYFPNNQFEELNTEIITDFQTRFIQLSSTYDTGEGTSNPSSEDYNLPSIQKSNFFILNSFFIFL